MAQNRDASTSGHSRFKWVIGTPYAVQGSSHLVEVPILYFIKFTLGMRDAGGQLFNSLRNLGWFVKPVWGYISDRFPILGYHRKSWFILMALLATVFWGATAGLAAADIRIPAIFLLTFNLAFATYAFVDVGLRRADGHRGPPFGRRREAGEFSVDGAGRRSPVLRMKPCCVNGDAGAALPPGKNAMPGSPGTIPVQP